MGTVASAPADFSVFRTLSGSTATLERAATLGEGLAISQWSRSACETLGYDMPGHHTLSLYLRGGEKSFRVGLDSLHGGAGKFCVLPAEHYSRWSMNDNVRFLHLYISRRSAWPAKPSCGWTASRARWNCATAPISTTTR